MPRPAKIWFRKQTGYYCVTLRGEKIRLSKVKAQAEKLFHELMAKKGEPEPPKPTSYPLSVLVTEHLDATKRERGEETHAKRSAYLRRFPAHVGEVEAREVKPHHITAWLKPNAKWGPSTQSFCRKLVKAAFHWATREGHLATNPLEKLPLGKVGRRERLLSAEERRKILTAVPPRSVDFLVALENTGCRPFSELTKLTAAAIA